MSGDKFRCKAEYDGQYVVSATRNGYQWSSICVDTIDQLEAVAVAALNYVVAARKQLTTAAAQNTAEH